jgi:glycosyltransferase involved in cell wall biosynthesis
MEPSILNTMPSVSATASPKPKLAMISTYNDMCGIAGYTRAVEKYLHDPGGIDVTVFDLDQYLLRHTHKRAIRLGDAHIEEIATQLRDGGFDCVNIQLEYGTLGKKPHLILRRLRKLALASPALCVTFHTVPQRNTVSWTNRWRLINKEVRMAHTVYKLLRRLQRERHVSVIVHTRRDARMLRDVYQIRNVHHHPLSFIRPGVSQDIRDSVTREIFPILHNLPKSAHLVGTFGFLSTYKGFDTVIRAMKSLPENYHMLVFGGVHPQTITREQPINPYIKKLLETAGIDVSVAEELKRTVGHMAATTGDPMGLIAETPRSLRGRIHFMGALSDDDFARAMATCDTVVMPYLEVGQTSSGPISMALEMGCRVIATRTLAFLQLDRYHKGEIEFFDVGNHVHLADLLTAPPANPNHLNRMLHYNTATNTQVYREACGFSLTETESDLTEKLSKVTA